MRMSAIVRPENRQDEARHFCLKDVILKPRVFIQRREGSRAEYFELGPKQKQASRQPARAIQEPPITYVT